MNLQTQSPDTDTSIEYEPSDEYDGDGTTLHLPSSTQPDRSWYYGALTGTNAPGKNTHVIYPDYSSMYPNILRTLNISPDTIVGIEGELERSGYDKDDCIWGYIDTREVKRCEDHEDWQNYTDPETYKAVMTRDSDGNWEKKWSPDPRPVKCYYLRPDVKEGFITGLTNVFAEKKEEHDGTHLYDSTKAIYNSLYGVLGYATNHNAFRLFDWQLAETVSLMGRRILEVAMETTVEYAQQECGVDAYVTHHDTDGCGISLAVDGQDHALEIGRGAVEYLRETAIPELLRDEYGYTEDLIDHHTLDAEIEYYAPSIYNHDAAKRYAVHTAWDEGEHVDEIDITGFEAIRSDVSDVTVDVQEQVFDFILRNNLRDVKQDVYEYVSGLIDDIESGDVPLEDIGVRAGIGQNLSEYGSASRRPQPQYRGAKYADAHIDGENLGEASKPYVFPIEYVSDDDLPKRYSADTAEDGDAVDAIAVEDPTTIEDRMVVDRTEVARKQVRDRVEPIFQNLNGYSWQELETGTTETSLDAYM